MEELGAAWNEDLRERYHHFMFVVTLFFYIINKTFFFFPEKYLVV